MALTQVPRTQGNTCVGDQGLQLHRGRQASGIIFRVYDMPCQALTGGHSCRREA